MNKSKGHGQGHAQFDCEYLVMMAQTLLQSANRQSSVVFRFAYLRLTLADSKGYDHGQLVRHILTANIS